MVDKYPRKQKFVAYRQIKDAMVLINRNSHQMLHLDELGGFIWNQIDGQTSIDTIINRIKEQYEIGEDDTPEKDVQSFLKELLDNGMVVYESK